ncbi:MAG: signal peptidase I [Phycisphaeraceae bacterium]
MTEKRTDESIKETLESLVIAFVLAFVFRAYVVEAFVIPTGSMAPTLLGQHVRVMSEQSGYGYEVDVPEIPQMIERFRQVGPLDPMTGAPSRMINPAVSPGDRILVLKYLYEFAEPRRWDVVVFKDPKDPKTNFIKRLIGLPEEEIAILDGNLYTREAGKTSDRDWRIARKSDRPKVQNAVWQPIYHSQYVPLDEGSRSRRGSGAPGWENPWKPSEASAWEVDNQRMFRLRSDEGALRFDFAAGNYGEHWARYAYNQFSPETTDEQIEDIRLSVHLTPNEAGQEVWLETTARLDDPAMRDERLRVTVASDGTVLLEAPDREDQGRRLLTQGKIDPLEGKHDVHLEWWVVDQQVILWMDGDQILTWSFELPLEDLMRRGAPDELPSIALGMSGGSAVIHRIELDRDLYYSSSLSRGPIYARSGLIRVSTAVQGSPLTLGPDEFFCVGDNGPRSNDGRYWTDVDPWVETRYFDPQADGRGIVPRRLLVGKAFFIYFPAPYAVAGNRWNVIPNFGDMGFIH